MQRWYQWAQEVTHISEVLVTPFEDEERSRLAGKVVEKMLRKRVLGSHKKQITTVAKWFPSHQEGDVKEVIDVMATSPSSPVERYGGGHRSNVRLTSFEKALEFADNRGVDTTWLEDLDH